MLWATMLPNQQCGRKYRMEFRVQTPISEDH